MQRKNSNHSSWSSITGTVHYMDSKSPKIILILSGKGGVGKSTTAVQLALTFRKLGKKVGLLDVDFCGPSIPRMLGLEGKSVFQSPRGWVPIYADVEQTLAVMSIGFLLKSRDDPVIWRGPKKTAMIKLFLDDVYWDNLDYLIIDTPPGTSDEHISVMENIRSLPVLGAVLVTTPQAVAVGDVRREVTFCRKTGIRILGIIENMSGFVCPTCAECTNIFSKGGGEALAIHAKVPFFGCIPIDPQLTQALESGISFIDAFEDSNVTETFKNIATQIASS